MGVYEAIFTHPWPFWAAGLSIGAFVTAFAWASGKGVGISSAYAEMCALGAGPEPWKLWFVLGLPVGGFASAALAGGVGWSTSVPLLATAFGLAPAAQLAVLGLGGVLVGFGARTAGGCTSGHSIVGIALGAKSSVVATIGFMIGGLVTAQVLFALFGSA